MSFDTEAVKKDLEVNVVVKINGVYYAEKQPDSGLVIDADKLVIDRPQINGVNVEVRRVSTPIGTFAFQLKENGETPVISSTIMKDETQWLDKECVVYAGFIRGNFDFADYEEIARTQITTVTKIANGYSIRSSEVTGKTDKEALNVNEILTTNLISTSTTLTVADGSRFPDSGLVYIDNEFIAYASKDGDILQGLTRGVLGSTAQEHDAGETVFEVTRVVDVNPIDLMLQIMLSDQGDNTNHPTYDVLRGGLGISPDDVDIASFEQIRDDNFFGEQHTYEIYDNSSMLKFFERTTLQSTTTRLITVNGKISLAVLDQIDFEEEIPLLDESSIIRTPTWKLDGQKVVNVIEAFWDYNPVTKNYESKQTFTDAESIALFGRKKPLKVEFEGVKTVSNGGAIVTDRSTRLLSRLSTARGEITVTSHFNAMTFSIGKTLQLVHRYLPQQGGTLGFSDRLEVMSRSVDLEKATVKTKLEFTSYTGIRIPFIAPSPRVVNQIDSKTIEVDDASCLIVGFRMKVFCDGPIVDGNPTAGSYLPDAPNEIESIVGNVVTFVNDFTSPIDNTCNLKMADYDNASEEQRARYGFVGENTGFFADDSKSYQIVF